MSPTRRQTKRDIQNKHQFSLLHPAQVQLYLPKLCMLIENVVTILKGVNHFSMQRMVFPVGAKMLIFGR